MYRCINTFDEIKLATSPFYFYFVVRLILSPFTRKCASYFSLPFVHKGRVYRFKMVAKVRIFFFFFFFFFFCEHGHVTEIWKTTSPKDFFNEILGKVGEHEYIYIADIKFKEKHFLSYRQKFMLIV